MPLQTNDSYFNFKFKCIVKVGQSARSVSSVDSPRQPEVAQALWPTIEQMPQVSINHEML